MKMLIVHKAMITLFNDYTWVYTDIYKEIILGTLCSYDEISMNVI